MALVHYILDECTLGVDIDAAACRRVEVIAPRRLDDHGHSDEAETIQKSAKRLVRGCEKFLLVLA